MNLTKRHIHPVITEIKHYSNTGITMYPHIGIVFFPPKLKAPLSEVLFQNELINPIWFQIPFQIKTPVCNNIYLQLNETIQPHVRNEIK